MGARAERHSGTSGERSTTSKPSREAVASFDWRRVPRLAVQSTGRGCGQRVHLFSSDRERLEPALRLARALLRCGAPRDHPVPISYRTQLSMPRRADDLRSHFDVLRKIAIIDNDAEVAFETMSLGLLRPGYRCVQLRMLTGTRIRLCTLLVHVELSDEINLYAERRSLLEVISQREKVIREQRDRISRLEAGLVSEYQTNEACIEVDATKVRLRP